MLTLKLRRRKKNWKNFFRKTQKKSNIIGIKTGKLNFEKWQKKRTLLPLKLENSILKSDKKTNIIFWERHRSLFLFLWNDDMSG